MQQIRIYSNLIYRYQSHKSRDIRILGRIVRAYNAKQSVWYRQGKQGIEIRRRYSMKCDAAEFAGMYETIYKDLYRYALCMMRNPHDAEDVVSEAVIKGYERIHTLRSKDAFKSWMFTILSNYDRTVPKGIWGCSDSG